MTNEFTGLLDNVLSLPMISRIRRNHGLEHATLHILSERFPGTPMAGHSTSGGFRIIGAVSGEAVQSAVNDALARMKAGEYGLAVHPNCGTNFATAGVMAGFAGAAAMFGVGRRMRDKLERLPLAASLATLALIFSQPIGLLLQARVTTDGHPGNLEVVSITTTHRKNMNIHHIITRG